MTEPLTALTEAGVSIWLDDLSRDRLTSGSLADLVGARSRRRGDHQPDASSPRPSPSGDAYDAQLRDLAARGVQVGEALRALTTFDVRWACDVLRPVYDATDGVDGRVSIEVDPRLAHDTARHDRRGPGAVVGGRPAQPVHQDPGRPAGPPGDRRLPGRGHQHQRHADLLADPLRRGDGRVPRRHGAGPRRPATTCPRSRRWPRSSCPGWTPRSTRGWTRSAPPRRPRCAARRRSPTPGWPTSTTSGCSPAAVAGAARRPAPARSGRCGPRPRSRTRPTPTPATSIDLVAPGVVNTMPEATLRAVADHGQVPADSVRAHYAESQQALDGLDALGIDYRDVVRTLEDDAVAKFDGAWEQLAERVTNTLRAQPSSAPAPADDRRPTRAAPTRDGRR